MRKLAITFLALIVLGVESASACPNVHGHQCDDLLNPIYLMSPPNEGVGEGVGEGCEIECPPANTPPPEPVMDCVREGLEYYCDVFPRSVGFSMSYSWNSTPEVALSIQGTTSMSVQQVSCQLPGTSGRVSLVVTAPNGQQSRRTFAFACEITAIAPEAGDPLFPVPSPPVEESQ
jgi:hypothetical protein